MSAAVYSMQRHHDVTGISGEGPVGTVVEFDNGDTVLHWDTATPSTTVYNDIRHITELHGHSGATTLVLLEPQRLVKAYAQVMFWLLGSAVDDRPMSVGPHPDWPDRLLVRFRDDRSWRLWIALMDGSTHASTHTQDGDEWVHSWTSHDGNVWLQHRTADFDIESVLPGNEYPDNNPYDDRD